MKHQYVGIIEQNRVELPYNSLQGTFQKVRHGEGMFFRNSILRNIHWRKTEFVNKSIKLRPHHEDTAAVDRFWEELGSRIDTERDLEQNI